MGTNVLKLQSGVMIKKWTFLNIFECYTSHFPTSLLLPLCCLQPCLHLDLFSLWLGPILSINTAFLHQSSYFFSLTGAMLEHFSAQLLLRYCLQFEFDLIHLHTVWGRGAASSIGTSMTDTFQTLPLALIGCVDSGVVASSKSNYSHWVEPQTADLYLILLSDHNNNFSKYNKKKKLQTTLLITSKGNCVKMLNYSQLMAIKQPYIVELFKTNAVVCVEALRIYFK